MTSQPDFLQGPTPSADGASDWSQAAITVVGLGVSGFAAADALAEKGAKVTVLQDHIDDQVTERAQLLSTLGVEVVLGAGSTQQLPTRTDLVVTSPGLSPRFAPLAQAAASGIGIWGEPELAWRLSHPDRPTPWLAITGTNGKTTTVEMLAAMLSAAGLRTAAVGNVGRPIIETVLDPEPYDVLAVELSSFQLHWSHSLSVHSAAVLNLHPDHLEWYDASMAAYQADKAKIYERAQHACIYNVAEPVTEQLVEAAEVIEGARAVGFTLGIPAQSMLGVVDDLIVDRAFVEQRRTSALELASINDVPLPGAHNVANALAAAALARSFGVPATAVRDGLRAMRPGPHRNTEVATIAGVAWVNDSKATNPHAAAASLMAYDSVVWIAGGQAKGTSFDELVTQARSRLRAVVLMGVDRAEIAAALARHAPDVPTRIIETTDTETMARVVAAANSFAQQGDVVLLAPGCASLDMFSDYGARGDAFAAAVAQLPKPEVP